MAATNHGLGPTRARVLALLQSSGAAMSVTDVADQLELHKNSARFHLDALVQSGFAERSVEATGLQGRPPLMFTATDNSPTMSNVHLLELTDVLLTSFVAPSPDAHARAEQAGHDWGSNLVAAEGVTPEVAFDELVRHLGQRGFTTVLEGDTMTFTRCPFRNTVSPATLPLLCTMHRGFLNGYLSASDTGRESGTIAVGPLRCVTDLYPVEPEAASPEDSQHPTRAAAAD